MKKNPITLWSSALLFALSLSACTTGQRAESARVANKGAGAVAEISGPTQAEILHVVMTVNNSELEAARFAKSRSQDQEVVALANHIIKDHTANNQQVMDLARRLNIEPDGNEISKSIRAGSATTMADLKNKEGIEFSQAYMTQQVKMHQAALETIEKRLLPNAENPELKSFLEQTRSSIASHLQHAQSSEQSLSGSSTQ